MFIIFSFCCAMTTNYICFLIFRLFQAFGACSTVVLCRAITTDFFPKSRVASILALVQAFNIISPVFSPLIGGFVVDKYLWNYIFIIIATYGVVVFLFVCFFLPETNRCKELKFLSSQGLWLNIKTLMGDYQFMGLLLSVSLLYGMVFVWIDFSPAILIHQFHIPRTSFGRYFMFPAIGDTIGALTIAVLSKKLLTMKVVMGGVLMIFLGLVMLLCFVTTNIFLKPYMVITSIFSIYFGFGFIIPKLFAIALSRFTNIAGLAAGLIGFCQIFFGGVVGIFCGLVYNYGFLGMTAMMIGIFIFSLLTLLVVAMPYMKLKFSA